MSRGKKPEFWEIPRIWEGQTVAILASGPSMSQEVADAVRGVKRIAINTTLYLAPDADLLYFCDLRWWQWHKESKEYRHFKGLKVTLENLQIPSVHHVGNYGQTGLFPHPWGVMTGSNSGYQCINLAVHLGAKEIWLLGYDMRITKEGAHWHDKTHPHRGQEAREATYSKAMLPKFPSLIKPLAERGVRVINATPNSALECFERKDLASLLADKECPAL